MESRLKKLSVFNPQYGHIKIRIGKGPDFLFSPIIFSYKRANPFQNEIYWQYA